MLDGRVVWVVVPAYDEQCLIGRTLDRMPSCVDRVVVVDDASADRTAEVVLNHGDPRVMLVRRAQNGGVGAAIVDGYRTFLQARGGLRDVCVVMAGDAQMDPEDLPRLIAALSSGAGYAKGNRFLHPEGYRSMPFLRVLGNRVLSWLTRRTTGYVHVGDSQCGYTAATREALAAIDLGALYPRYGFPNDVLVKLAASGASVVDVPVRAVYGEEVSGINAFTVIPRILGILRRGRREIQRARRRASAPHSTPSAAPPAGTPAR